MYSISMAAMESATTGYLLWRVTTKWRAAADRVLTPLGLTHAQFSLLASLHALIQTGAGPSQRQLADFSGLEPIFVSKLARALERSGLVVRAEHPTDPRAVELRLTERGSDLALRAAARIRELNEELTAPIGGLNGRRNCELTQTLRTLLDQNGADSMPTPTLTGQNISEASGAVQALLDKALARTDLTSNEFIALRVLTVRGQFEPPAALHQFFVAQPHLHLDASAAAGLLAGLEAKGLISGSAPDGPGPVQLTDRGAAEYERVAGYVATVTTRLYAEFDAADLAVAHDVLVGVIERANRIWDEI
jgi:DNA-binding MarR family transcriptional regulator